MDSKFFEGSKEAFEAWLDFMIGMTVLTSPGWIALIAGCLGAISVK